MLIGKIKDEEDLLKNGFKIVDRVSKKILCFGVTNINVVYTGPDKGATDGFIVTKKQGTRPYIMFKDNKHILHAKLGTLVRLLNSNEFTFYY